MGFMTVSINFTEIRIIQPEKGEAMSKKGIRNLLIIFAIIMLIAIVFRNNPAAGLKAEEAEQIAQSVVPSSFTLVRTEKDDDKYEVNFTDDATGGTLEVDVSKDTEAVISADYSAMSEMGGTKQVLTEADAENRVREIFDTVKAIKSVPEFDDGMYYYNVRVTTGEFYAEVELNAETGDIIEVEVEYSGRAD